jgi:hypothetical protein
MRVFGEQQEWIGLWLCAFDASRTIGAACKIDRQISPLRSDPRRPMR